MTNEDSAFGPGMMFGIPGPGPKSDGKKIKSDPKKEKGKKIKPKKKMKNLQTFDEFVNENYSVNEAKIEKMSKAWYYEEVKIDGFEPYSTIKADKDSTKAGTALYNFLEKDKAFDKSGFTLSGEMPELKTIKAGDKAEFTLIDAKTDKDFKVEIESRDKDPISGKNVKYLYIKVYRK
jgi:hypothetical protein